MYEHEGVIIPYRTHTGRRFYSHADIVRIKCIRDLIKKIGLNLEGIRRLFSLLPCWEVKGCSRNDRLNCPAYQDSSKPCWMFIKVVCRKVSTECKTCSTYMMSTNCHNRMKLILRGIGYEKA
ncbi:MAG: MerR family transcriptional regulator [Deltaproteobacteria bacterium]|nr:MerR family transcriptional regulator [Deltaproteobacteria bacterium]MCL5791988.1 MerR family transcriptional regulator [Deltaproteobacteria bacterium]